MRRAVILAGGRGRRLLPYTNVFPKPLMPVGERPILELVVEQLRVAGFERVTMAVGYLAHMIQGFFEDGSRFGLQIDYSLEDEPLGTAGPLSLIEGLDEPFLVANGDILTDLDFGAFYRSHVEGDAIATLAVYKQRTEISLGVLDIADGDRIVGYREKPTIEHDVSTGIYCFDPEVLRYLPEKTYCDLPVLVRSLFGKHRVAAYPLTGKWLDIGRPEDYELAHELVQSGRYVPTWENAQGDPIPDSHEPPSGSA